MREENPVLRPDQRLFLTMTLKEGSKPEPPVSNQHYLESFLEIGVWSRVANAAAHLEVLRGRDSSDVQRMSALAGLYQQLGLHAEDAISMLTVWSVWAQDKNQNIADLLNRLVIRFNRTKGELGEADAATLHQRFAQSRKRVDVYAMGYLSSLSRKTDSALMESVGISWRRIPSVKDVPKHLHRQWGMMPDAIRQLIQTLTGKNSTLLASCYNKIKHGPQLVIADPGELASSRGLDPKLVHGMPRTIRILLDGARTQESNEEYLSSSRVAPLLIPDGENARRLFFQSIVHTANVLFMTGTWLFNSNFPGRRRDIGVRDPFVASLIEEQGRHLAHTFGTPS